MSLKLTQSAYFCMQHGSPEYQVYCSIPENGISYNKLMNKLGNVGKNGYEYGLKHGWFRFDKKTYRIYRNREINFDYVCEQIKNINEGFIPGDKKIIKLLKDRHYLS